MASDMEMIGFSVVQEEVEVINSDIFPINSLFQSPFCSNWKKNVFTVFNQKYLYVEAGEWFA